MFYRLRYSAKFLKDAYYDKDARGVNPIGNYKSGILIDSKIFGSEATTDNKWISLGPFNPQQGELARRLVKFADPGRVFCAGWICARRTMYGYARRRIGPRSE